MDSCLAHLYMKTLNRRRVSQFSQAIWPVYTNLMNAD